MVPDHDSRIRVQINVQFFLFLEIQGGQQIKVQYVRLNEIGAQGEVAQPPCIGRGQPF